MTRGAMPLRTPASLFRGSPGLQARSHLTDPLDSAPSHGWVHEGGRVPLRHVVAVTPPAGGRRCCSCQEPNTSPPAGQRSLIASPADQHHRHRCDVSGGALPPPRCCSHLAQTALECGSRSKSVCVCVCSGNASLAEGNPAWPLQGAAVGRSCSPENQTRPLEPEHLGILTPLL